MPPLNIEVVLEGNINSKEKTNILSITKQYLAKNEIPTRAIHPIDIEGSQKERSLKETLSLFGVKYIVLEDGPKFSNEIDFFREDISWHIYALNNLGAQVETCTNSHDEEVQFAHHYSLPSSEFFSLWENLIYENDIKPKLLKYALSVLKFAKCRVNPNIISCNKVILLHGPPGTGKTSLCKAIAQKLSVRLGNEYSKSLLIEIDSSNLFSKWFSESGKMINRMFESIQDIISMPGIFVCVLVDEVESLTQSRDRLSNGTDPSDALKVVNSVLTHIDQIKRHPNVLILTTSNITKAIDVAFVDRADIKQYIGLPGEAAIYQIYNSCIVELKHVGIIEEDSENMTNEKFKELLMCVSKESVGLSGRMLRKIPFLAHSLLVKDKNIMLSEFLDAMQTAVENEIAERNHLVKGNQILVNGQ